MTRLFIGTILGVLLSASTFVVAQRMAPSGTYVSASALATVLKNAGDVPSIDANAQTVQAGPNQVLINIGRRTKAGVSTDRPLAHNALTEVYYVIEGAATVLTGGTLVAPSDQANDLGGNVRGSGIRDGESRRISKGDVLAIAAGTPHAFSDIEDTLVFLNVRINPTSR